MLFKGQVFPYAMSLGADCEVSVRLKQFNCRKLRSIFDDIGIPLPDLIELINNQLSDFAALENLEVKKDLWELLVHKKKKELRVVDKKYNAELWHYFSYDVPIEDQYDQAITRLKGIGNKFLKEISTPLPVLFIHKQSTLESLFLPDDVKNQYRRLLDCIKSFRLGKPFKLLVLGRQEIFAKDWGIEDIETRQLVSAIIKKSWLDDEFTDPIWVELTQSVESYRIF